MIIWGNTIVCLQHYIHVPTKVNDAQTLNKEDSPCAEKLTSQNSLPLFYKWSYDYEFYEFMNIMNIMNLIQQIRMHVKGILTNTRRCWRWSEP